MVVKDDASIDMDNRRADELRKKLDLLDKLEAADATEASQGSDLMSRVKQNAFGPDGEPSFDVRRAMNIIPGVGRAVVKNVVDSIPQNGSKGLNNIESQAADTGSVQRLKNDLALALRGGYPSSSELYGLGPVSGFVADVAQDPTGAALGLTARGAATAGRAAAETGINALRLPPSAAMALPSSNIPTLRERLSGALSWMKNRIGDPKAVQEAASTPIGTSLEKLGSGVYQSRLGSLNEGVGSGLQKPSEALLNAGVVTTKGGLAKRIQDRISFLAKVNDDIISKATSLPPQVNTIGNQLTNMVDLRAVATKARAFLAPYAKINGYTGIVNNLEGELANLDTQGQVPLNQAREMSRNLKKLAEAAYTNEDAALKPEFYRKVRQGLADSIGDTISQISPEAAKLYRANNMEMGSLANALPAAEKMGETSFLKEVASDLAAGGAGYLFTHNPVHAAQVAAVKRGVQTAVSPGVTMGTGWLLNRTGKLLQKPGAEAAARQLLIHSGSPWSLFSNDEQGQPALKK